MLLMTETWVTGMTWGVGLEGAWLVFSSTPELSLFAWRDSGKRPAREYSNQKGPLVFILRAIVCGRVLVAS